MASDTQVSESQLVLANADRVGKLIESEPDPIVRSLLRLVYGEFLTSIVRGELPEGGLDLLYCFQHLQRAFARKDAMENALRGDYADPNTDLEWT